MKRVLFLTLYDETGASSRVLVYDFIPYFRKAGVHVDLRPLITGNVYQILGRLTEASSPLSFLKVVVMILWHFRRRWRDVVDGWKYDMVVVQKDVLPFGLYWLLRLGQKRIVFMTDDPIWLKHAGVGSVPVLSSLLVLYRRHLMNRICRGSRLVISDSPIIRDYGRKYCRKSAWLRTGIETGTYKNVRRKSAGSLIVGWIGSPGTSYLLKEIVPYLESLALEIPFELQNVGGSPLHSDTLAIKNIPWTQENEIEALGRFDIGLMPSDDQPFNESRFSRKYLTYGVAKVPTLTLSTAINRMQISDGVNGLLYSNTKEDFTSQLRTLLMDRELRTRLGNAAYEDVMKHYDLSIVGEALVELIVKEFEERPEYSERVRSCVSFG